MLEFHSIFADYAREARDIDPHDTRLMSENNEKLSREEARARFVRAIEKYGDPLTEKQEETMCTALFGKKPPELGLYYGLLLLCTEGMRAKEVSVAKMGDFIVLPNDPETRYLIVRNCYRDKTEDGNELPVSRFIPISPQVDALLLEREELLKKKFHRDDVSDIPIACGGKFSKQICAPEDLEMTARELLLRIGVHEDILSACEDMLRTDAKMRKIERAVHPAIFLLRRSLKSALSDVGFSDVDIGYILGLYPPSSFFGIRDR